MNLSENQKETVKELTDLKIQLDRYTTLRRYIYMFFENHSLMSKEDAELIIMALSDEEIKLTKEKKENEHN